MAILREGNVGRAREAPAGADDRGDFGASTEKALIRHYVACGVG